MVHVPHLRLLLLFLLCIPATAQTRTRYNFNPNWRVFVGDPANAADPSFNDSSWKPVSTPYAWNEDSAFRVSIHDLPTGVAWYRKHFRLPTTARNHKVFIEFEGIRQAGEVYLNGKFIGIHEDGVMAFGFDLTPLLKPAPEENILAVRTDNRWDYKEKATGTTFQWNNTNFYANYGGISKNVWLHITPQIYQTLPLVSSLGTTGTYIYATDIDIEHNTATINAESQVHNDSTQPQSVVLATRVTAPDGTTVATVASQPTSIAPSQSATLTTSSSAHNLHFWSWGYGYLYNVTTTLFINGKPQDSVTTRTGFRQTAFHDGTIFLNNRAIQVHGYAQRTTNEWPAVGLSVPPWMSDLSNGLMVQSNGNLVRWMHVTPWKQDVESSDRVGLIESMPAGDAEGDSRGRQWQQRVELMRDAIVYNRNNPSMLFYESGNKGISDAHMAEMKAVRDQYDPHGGRAIGAREMLASGVAEYGGEMLYINKSATKPLWAHEYNRDEGARAFADDFTPPFHKDSPLYNRNQDSFAIEDIRRWNDYYVARPGTGTRVSSGGVNIIFADSNTHFRGDNNYRRSGEVDAMRLPKEGFYSHQIMWNGWVDVEHPGIHIMGHWNYAAPTTKPVYVVATAAKVQLKLNNRSLGFGTSSDTFLFTFPVITYQQGKLEAVAYDSANHVIATTSIRTAGEPAALRLTPHTSPQGLHADGADMALIDVEVIDKAGNRCPIAKNKIHFTLTGAAEWRGGIAQGSSTQVPVNTEPVAHPGITTTPAAPLLHEDNYILAHDLPVEEGINRIILRSLPHSGAITLTAEAAGLIPATIHLTSKPVTITDGLSTDFPAAAQPLNLGRGPTPSTPSFTPHRIAIAIASATAGANATDATLSYDDNETTSWSNAPQKVTDGLPARPSEIATQSSSASLDTAWIEYTFAQPQQPTDLELKLNGFRLRRYPLRITLDGATVWEGLTPTTLGYCTLPLMPAHGSHLRITLTAPPIETGAATVEVNGKIDSAGNQPLGKTGAPILSIIEAEIYTTK